MTTVADARRPPAKGSRKGQGQSAPRSLRRAPVNGHVTKAHLLALRHEFEVATRQALRAGEIDEPPTWQEFANYVVEAIIDHPPKRPVVRARIAAGARRRWARRRERG